MLIREQKLERMKTLYVGKDVGTQHSALLVEVLIDAGIQESCFAKSNIIKAY